MVNNLPAGTVRIEVAYALPHRQWLKVFEVPTGTCAQAAVVLSGIAEDTQQPELLQAPMGVFGEAFGTKGLPAASEYVVQEGDRIEVYRPLLSDPKEVRKRRAAQRLNTP